MLVIPATQEVGQEDHEFEVSLDKKTLSQK
jgi:hypothetical protein